MSQLDKYFEKLKKRVPTLQVRMESKQDGFNYSFSSTVENQVFHSASIGKVFCSTLVMMLVEAGKLSLTTRVVEVLPPTVLSALFVYKGIDYKEEVTIEHLLSHTSGINDYFEGKTHNKSKFIDIVLQEQDRIFTPNELLDFTRNNQVAVGKPGSTFLYSDSGFIVLAFILEAIYKMPYVDVLNHNILYPLKMKDTLLCFYDPAFEPRNLAPIVFKNKRMELANSLSCDYAGGGLQTSTRDLSVFLHALFSSQLISLDSVHQMMKPRHSFHGIMRYGLGMIEVKMERLVPWYRHYAPLYGGLGSLSVFAFYDPVHQAAYVMNLGSPSKMRLGFMALVRMVKFLDNERQKSA